MASIDEIKSAIVDREEEIKQKFEKERIIRRDKEEEIEKLIATDIALIITGVRRCGKSILAFMLGKDKKYAYVNFEDERLSIEANELNKVLEAIYSLKNNPEILVFDEIQNVDGWERFIARIIQNKKIIITGSNARLLSKELSTFLTGRHLDFVLFPFSFKEFLALKNFKPDLYSTKDIAKIKNYLAEYIDMGGFPSAYKLGKLFLMEIYTDIIERDVIQRYKIRYVKALKELARLLISNISNEISYNQLKNILRMGSVNTAKNYVSYLQNAYIIFVLERFSFKLKEQMLAPKKVYCIDTGIVNAVGFKVSENFGRAVENVVAIELLRKAGKEIYYWKDHQQREVDFVVKTGKQVRQLIQVCYNMLEISTREREIKSLLKASKELKCNTLFIITGEYEAEETIQGKKIKFIPLWKWLLL